MKSKILVFLLVLSFMLLGATSSAFASAKLLGGVSDTDPSSYTDAEKDNDSIPQDDDDYCWAFASSNVLAWTGWDAGFFNEDAIANQFLTDWYETPAINGSGGGQGKFGFEWWLTGSVNTSDPLWHVGGTGADYNTGTGGYYTPTDFSTYSRVWDDNMSTMDVYTMQAIDQGYGTTLGLAYELVGGGFKGHEITLWGYEYGTSGVLGVYVSDSDNNEGISDINTMEYYPIYLDDTHSLLTWDIWRLDNYYGTEDWIMNTLYGLHPYDEGPGPGEPVPEPATILLVGSGLFGLFGIGRRKFNRG